MIMFDDAGGGRRERDPARARHPVAQRDANPLRELRSLRSHPVRNSMKAMRVLAESAFLPSLANFSQEAGGRTRGECKSAAATQKGNRASAFEYASRCHPP